MENMGCGQERLKGIAEKEAEEEQQYEEEEDTDLTPHENKIAFKGAYRSFVIPGAPKTDIDSYFDQTKAHIKTLIKNQIKEMGFAKIIMTLWLSWKKPIKLLIELDPEDLEDAQDIGDNAGDKERPEPPASTSLQGSDEFEKEEMKKSRSLAKNKLTERHDWLVDYVPKPIKNAAAFLRAANSILGLYV